MSLSVESSAVNGFCECGSEVRRSGEELIGMVQFSISSLTPLQRDVINSHYFQEMSVSEIAEWLGIPRGTVRSRLYRGCAGLRRRLDENFGWEAVQTRLSKVDSAKDPSGE